jgi:hypothetical protein
MRKRAFHAAKRIFPEAREQEGQQAENDRETCGDGNGD